MKKKDFSCSPCKFDTDDVNDMQVHLVECHGGSPTAKMMGSRGGRKNVQNLGERAHEHFVALGRKGGNVVREALDAFKSGKPE